MERKQEIPEPIKSKIDQMLSLSGDAFREGDLEKSLDIALQAWDLIPEPKSKWDYYSQSLSIGFIEDYTSLGNIEQARHWISIAYEMYDDPDRENHYVLMFEGSSLYKLDLLDEAYGIFDRVYTLFGRDGFKGEHLQYLEFYLKKRAGNDG